MAVIGIGLIWSSYTLMFWGYTLVRGYKISIAEIVVPGRWDGKWPPPMVVDPGDQPESIPPQHPGDMPQTYPHNPNVPA